jgi:excisionase family DNA binding protein
MEPFVEAAEAAKHAGVSQSLVRKWTTRTEDAIPHHRLPGGRGVRYRLSEVSAWLERSEGDA